MIILALVFASLTHQSAEAQQTIINVPSSEVLPAGDLILKESNRFRPFSDGGYTTITPSATFGVGHGMEIFGAVGTALDGSTQVRGDIGAKKVWFLGKTTRLTAGGTISPYLNQHAQPDTFIFTHLSKRVKQTKTSITAGAYINGRNRLPDQGGVLLGLEQVIIPNKFRLVADWISSEQSIGRLGVGFKYRPVPTLSITSAVIIPNEDTDNIGFNFSISKFVSLKDINLTKRRL